MLTALLHDSRIYAAEALKGPSYCCPLCRSAMILRKGDVRIHHFAHRPDIACGWGQGETETHLEAKFKIYQAFKDRSLRAEAEWVVPQLAGDRRADVFIWEMGAGPVAIELQHSAIGLAEIAERSASYMAAGIAVLWLPFIGSAALVAAQSSGGLRVNRYLPRPFERWLAAFGHGPIWFWSPDERMLYRGRFEACLEWSDIATWSDRNGGINVSRGKWVRVLRYATLALEGPFDANRLVLRRYRRKPAQSGSYDLPGGPAAALEPSAGAGPVRPAAGVWLNRNLKGLF